MTTQLDEPPHRDESGLTPLENARLLSRAVGNGHRPGDGWLRNNRFPTRQDKRELVKQIAEKDDANMIERASLTVHGLLEDKRAKYREKGVRLTILMEAQNQRQELAAMHIFDADPPPSEPAKTVNQQINIVIEKAHEDDEYLEFRRAKLLGHSFKPGADGGGNGAELASGATPGATG